MVTLVLNPESAEPRLIHLDKASSLIGSAPEADVSFNSEFLSENHARIEQNDDGVYLINLQSKSEILVNGEAVSFHKLNHGDRLKIAEVNAVVMLTEEVSPEVDAPVPFRSNPEAMPVSQTSSFIATSHSLNCPQCGFPVSENMRMCPQCGRALGNQVAMPMDYIAPLPASQSGPGILPVIAFLAALSVLGAPVAFVLGLMTLSIIRRRGGTSRDQNMAKWSIGLGLFWMMAGLLAAGGGVQKIRERKQRDVQERYEAKVIRALKNLACAQKYAHTIEYCDADEDGAGEYADLEVLANLNSPFFDSDLADGEAYGYRFDLREVSEGQFLAVAEPVFYHKTGVRTFVIDHTGQIRGADSLGKRFGQLDAVLPVLQGETGAYYEIDDEIAKDVLNYVKSLSATLPDQEKKQRILARLRSGYSLTTVGRELTGMKETVDRFVAEQKARAIYLKAQAALKEGHQDVALANLAEILEEHPSFSEIAAVEREMNDLRSQIAQQREQNAVGLFTQAEEMERQGGRPQEVQELYQRIEKLYPETDVAARIEVLKPELQRQLRESNAEDIFSEVMELSPERDYEKILNLGNQLRRNYNDTALFGKVMDSLSEKERKARASSWRVKTTQSIENGQMRGALAQLESAANENPDLMYDLRDLCIQLYRSVAEQVVAEGDSRGALLYYTRLNQLLQGSNSNEKVDEDLLAQLHNDVGQADYQRSDYSGARWHLANAAWKYQDDAQFNVRLGVASLYSGLYQPAEVALTQALAARPNMEPALLYRAYLNMRVVLVCEQTIGKGFGENVVVDEVQEVPAESDRENFKLSIESEIDGDITINSEDSSEEIPQPEKPVYTSAGDSWSFRFAEGKEGNTAIPQPTDLDLVMHYDYYTSRSVLPDLLKYLQELQETVEGFALEQVRARGSDSSLTAVKLGQMMEISDYRNKLSDLRKRHFEDLKAQQKLCDMMEEMMQRAHAARIDIKSAGAGQLNVQSLSEHILPKLDAKCTSLFKAAGLIKNTIEKEIEMREEVLKITETALKRSASPLTGSNDNISRSIQTLLRRTDGSAQIDMALLNLRDSMEISVDLDEILQVVEGRVELK